ncbi:MAG: hypothetical protein EPO27_20070 [Betaproteobacteria bacterium]|nr:MAG: hypothetical protein EPO27_20070 [Betaproteobacteria bacterium]
MTDLAVFALEVVIAVAAAVFALSELVRYVRENAVLTKLTELFPGPSGFFVSELVPAVAVVAFLFASRAIFEESLLPLHDQSSEAAVPTNIVLDILLLVALVPLATFVGLDLKKRIDSAKERDRH